MVDHSVGRSISENRAEIENANSLYRCLISRLPTTSRNRNILVGGWVDTWHWYNPASLGWTYFIWRVQSSLWWKWIAWKRSSFAYVVSPTVSNSWTFFRLIHDTWGTGGKKTLVNKNNPRLPARIGRWNCEPRKRRICLLMTKGIQFYISYIVRLFAWKPLHENFTLPRERRNARPPALYRPTNFSSFAPSPSLLPR